MDEVSLLRRSRNDIPERSPHAVARGRTALLAQIGGEAPSAPNAVTRRRRTAAWTGFSVLGATAVTAVLVVGNVLGVPGGRDGADAAAASVLNSAASATLEFSDPVVTPGRYMLVRTDAAYMASGSVGGTDSAEGQPASFLESSRQELYVPADRADDWVWIQYVRTPLQTFGAESEALAREILASYEEFDSDTFRRLPGGEFSSGGSINGDYGAYPRDPKLLLAAIYRESYPGGPSRDAAALTWIADTLRDGTVPAEFRAALYQAAAEIPGVTITEQQATLNGTTGIAVGRVEPSSRIRQDFIIDPKTGQFIGEREVSLDGFDGVPAGTALSWTTVTTTVVDTAPDESQFENHG